MVLGLLQGRQVLSRLSGGCRWSLLGAVPALPAPRGPSCVYLSVGSFHDDAPKDYRQVSLTAVKQRFEDKRYEEISLEEVPRGAGGRPARPGPCRPLTVPPLQVLSYGQLCAALGVKQESPEPAPFLSAGDIHAFLSSPSGRRAKR